MERGFSRINLAYFEWSEVYIMENMDKEWFDSRWYCLPLSRMYEPDNLLLLISGSCLTEKHLILENQDGEGTEPLFGKSGKFSLLSDYGCWNGVEVRVQNLKNSPSEAGAGDILEKHWLKEFMKKYDDIYLKKNYIERQGCHILILGQPLFLWNGR